VKIFDLAHIRRELESAPPGGPLPPDVATAVVADTFRDAGLVPPSPPAFRELAARGKKPEHRPQQLGAVAHILSATSLRAATVEALAARPPADGAAALDAFLDAIWPLTAQLLLENPFRQEELLRRWIETWGGGIAGETPEESARRLDQLDYRKTLVELEKAERSRLAEAQKRAEALRKAREEAEEAARGWRE
jgi:hypothetical protein